MGTNEQDDEIRQELLDWQLSSALGNNDSEGVAQAIAAGANPNRSFAGETALHIAVERGEKELVNHLLQHGADPSVKTRFYKHTPLHIAADRGDIEIARRLIAAGADKEARTNGGWTPFHAAVARGHFRLARLLVEEGADVNAINNAGETALHFIENTDPTLFAWLADKIDRIDVADENGATPLIYAAGYGRSDIAAILLKKGASTEHRDYYGNTPAETARARGFPEVAYFIDTVAALRNDTVTQELHDQLYQGAMDLLQPFVDFSSGRAIVSDADRKAIERGSEILRRVFSINPLNWAAMWLLGFACRAAGQGEAALEAFQAAYAIERLNLDVGRELSLQCINMGKAEEAVRVCAEVLELGPFDAGLIANYGLALLISGRTEEAVQATSASLEISPNDPITLELAGLVAAVQNGRRAAPDRWPPAGAA